jgi:hypothetical protein
MTGGINIHMFYEHCAVVEDLWELSKHKMSVEVGRRGVIDAI